MWFLSPQGVFWKNNNLFWMAEKTLTDILAYKWYLFNFRSFGNNNECFLPGSRTSECKYLVNII